LAQAATKAGFPMEAVDVPAQDAEVVQLVTMIKRPSVEVKNVSLIENSNDLVDGDNAEEKTTRKAVLAEVKVDKFDFYLVGVHLKSKRPSAAITASPLEMRDRQCQVISERLHDLVSKGKEKDVLLVGDYNMTPEGQQDGGEPSDAKNFATLDQHHELRFLSSESKDKTHMGFYQGSIRRSKLDGFAIAHPTEAAYVKGSFRVLNYVALGVNEKQFTDTRTPDFLSDHYPIVAEFDKSKDAD
jgi:endonuclease/exonuclease/phosphatase family metal-dependent hydrolase